MALSNAFGFLCFGLDTECAKDLGAHFLEEECMRLVECLSSLLITIAFAAMFALPSVTLCAYFFIILLTSYTSHKLSVLRVSVDSLTNLDVTQAQRHCGHRLSGFCIGRIGISLLHGVEVIQGSCDRLIKAAAPSSNFPRTLHQYWLTRYWTRF